MVMMDGDGDDGDDMLMRNRECWQARLLKLVLLNTNHDDAAVG